jgi:hypothetical protein
MLIYLFICGWKFFVFGFHSRAHDINNSLGAKRLGRGVRDEPKTAIAECVMHRKPGSFDGKIFCYAVETGERR